MTKKKMVEKTPSEVEVTRISKKELEARNKIQHQLEDELRKKQEELKRQLEQIFTSNILKKTELELDKFKEFQVKVSRQEIINKINKAYRNEKLVFVMGAGISMNYGLPSWDVLLQKIMVTTIEKEQSASNALSKLFTELFSPSPLIAGRYLQKYYEKKNSSFEEAVRKVLYENLNISKTSSIMDEIVKFCVAAGKSPNIDSIITYNFDDIVEQHLLKTNVEIPFRPIYGVGMNPEPGELPIYHVHGFLPEKSKLNDSNQITFGENVYHKQYTDIYSWNNIVQINKFRDFTCLFIGSSLTDPNIRRLLDIARIQKGDKEEFHYIFKKKYKSTEIGNKLKIILEDNKILFDEKVKAQLNFDETVNFLIKTIETFEENDSSSFGVKTLWVEDYYEIPEILKQIRTLKQR
ncbi:MAG: SIR2 family protein [Bacteroidota bacterium]